MVFPELSVLNLLGNLMNLFEVPLHSCVTDNGKVNHTLLIHWLNDLPHDKIEKISFSCENAKEFDYILKTNKKEWGELELFSYNRNNADSEESYNISNQFSTVLCEKATIRCLPLSRSSIINVLNVVELYIKESQLSNQYLKQFLRNWAAGKSNSRLNQAFFAINEPVQLKTILEGFPFVKKDPRTTKRYIETDAYGEKLSFWIFGGYDIQLHDGRTATLQWHKFQRKFEDSTIPLRWIQKYEDVNELENNIDRDAHENMFREPENELNSDQLPDFRVGDGAEVRIRRSEVVEVLFGADHDVLTVHLSLQKSDDGFTGLFLVLGHSLEDFQLEKEIKSNPNYLLDDISNFNTVAQHISTRRLQFH
ncbi:hypothetical protein GCK72_014898 [Caenorhabditis remanei]|uniref:F-box associated domain-containing protein n=1 Tax=Caenorhabditis remanei TaxID=31234 RepID=A0A6A5GSN4_CAERE|nr:hypothetical protein GCK72_014898 [Caenorhabditis remanei]KAF1758440.1 hypothetical protein GCK72_014898 [Caenorhabditis remanei]